MRLPLIIVLSAVALGAAPAFAAPAAPATSPLLTPVAMGCGVGRTRDKMGRCHHPFNRFDHHHRFQVYKKTHCKPMRTPDGTVGFCKV